MDFNSKTFYQAVLFGIVSIILTLLLSEIFGFMKPQLPEECDIWNKYYVMELVSFLVGFLLRYLLVNKQIAKYMYEE